MKYLPLFEAFESKTLSNVVNFLRKKLKNKTQDRFIHHVKEIMKYYDYPIDKISDDDINYLKKSQALSLKPDSTYTDNKPYYIKFWFSLEDGYFGYTGVGSKHFSFSKRISKKDEIQEPFTENELEYIKTNLNVKTGLLTPIENYQEMEHGGEYFGILGKPTSTDGSTLVKFKLYRTDDGLLSAVQNVKDGAVLDAPNWRKWGRCTWTLYRRKNGRLEDHSKIHKYEDNGLPLHIKIEKVEDDNPFNFNLPFDEYNQLVPWGTNDDYKKVEMSDFCIVLNINNISKSQYTPVSASKLTRKESKIGSTKLMTNNEIRNININRYLKALIDKLGIRTDKLKNLEILLLRQFCGKYAFLSIFSRYPHEDNLKDFISNLRILMSIDQSNPKVETLIKILEQKSIGINNNHRLAKDCYNKFYELLEEKGSENQLYFFNILIRIGNKIKIYLESHKVDDLDDLKIIMYKIKSINGISNDLDYAFSKEVTRILGIFPSGSSGVQAASLVDNLTARIERYKNADYSEDIRRANLIEKYVDEILK